MATLREIRRRISGVKSTQKITRAMKMVAAAKLRRAQDSILSARPYAHKLRELLQHLSGKVDTSINPLLTARPVERVALVVVTADRGLCGAFNTNISRAAIAHMKNEYSAMMESGELKLVCVGKKGYDYFNKRDYKIASRHIGIFAALEFARARAIMDELVGGYRAGEFDRVEIIYNEFKSVAQQKITIEQLLPIPSISPEDEKDSAHPLSQIDYIYEPSAHEIINAIVPRHLNFQMWRVLLESNAAEQAARMRAMDQATSNANDLIRVLNLTYNKARQAAITKEILEIVSGAEALRKSA